MCWGGFDMKNRNTQLWYLLFLYNENKMSRLCVCDLRSNKKSFIFTTFFVFDQLKKCKFPG